MTPHERAGTALHHSGATRRPWALDLFCGAGGVTRGLQRAGFRVLGIDSADQPRYVGDKFIQDDVFGMLRVEGFLDRFDFIWASPPCKAHTRLGLLRGGLDYPDLIPKTREFLEASGKPWVIENVEGATLRSSSITLCGGMFGLSTYRHRLFEASFPLKAPRHRRHVARVAPLSKSPGPGEFIHVVGHFADLPAASRAMGIDWMKREELSQAIPPAYSQYIGEYFLRNHYAGSQSKVRAGNGLDKDTLQSEGHLQTSA